MMAPPSRPGGAAAKAAGVSVPSAQRLELGTHSVDLPGLRERHRTENLRREWPKVCDTVGLGPNHDDEEGRIGYRLLPCQIAVRRDEPSESRLLHAREQVSVLDA